MDYPNTTNGLNNDGSSILDGICEKKIWSSVITMNNWVKTIRDETPNKTMDEMRIIINNDSSRFSEYLKYMNWGDCFMIDKKTFNTGGARRFVDYPGLSSPKNGDTIIINGKPHTMHNVGLFTFDTYKQHRIKRFIFF